MESIKTVIGLIKASGIIRIANQQNFNQLLTFGYTGEHYMCITLGNNVPGLWLLSNGNWGAYANPLNNPNNIKFKAVVTQLGYNDNPYVIMLGKDDGEIYAIDQPHDWKWYGRINPKNPDKKPPTTFKWITSGKVHNKPLQVVLLGENGRPYLLWQENYGNGDWHWGGFPGIPDDLKFTTVQLGQGNGGNLQAVLTDTFGHPYLIWQDYRTGNWHWYGKKLPTDGSSFNSIQQSFLGDQNNLQNIFLGGNDLYLIWQESETSKWNWYGRLPINHDEFQGKIAFYHVTPEGDTLASLKYAVYIFKLDSSNIYKVFKLEYTVSTGQWKWEGFFTEFSI